MRLAAIRALALVAALLAAPANGATPSPQVKAIVDRWIEASGGRAAFLADTALHVRGRLVAEGLRGTFEYWTHGPQRLLEHERLGTLRMRSGWDGTSGWRTDPDGHKVVPLEGKDLEALRGEAWFRAEQWARDDQGGGQLREGQRAYTQGRTLVSLEVTPPAGPPKTLWFDEATGLMTRATHRRDQYGWSERYSGWRTLAGRKRWTRAAIGDSARNVAAFERHEVDSVRIEPPRDRAAFSPPAARLRPVTWLRARGVARLPFRYRRGHVWLRASVDGGPPADFILDTGCTMSAVDLAHARAIGLAAEGATGIQGAAGTGEAGWAPVRGLRIAGPDGDGVVVPDLKVAVLEINDEFYARDWDDAAGLIGYDVLSRFVVDIDFDRRIVTLSDPASFEYRGTGTAVPFTLHAGIPTVDVTLNRDCTGRFIVDVGNAAVTSVSADHVDACRLLTPRRKDVQLWVGGIGGAMPETVCRLDSLRIGPFVWSEPVTGLTLHHVGSAGSRDVQGNIGTGVLDRFRCTFDYARSRLWLERGARYDRPDRLSRSGLFLQRRSGRVWIVGVVRRSPAEEAGLKARDVLKAVNGRAIERWTPEELDALLVDGPPGTVVTLTVERELLDQQIELTLADVL